MKLKKNLKKLLVILPLTAILSINSTKIPAQEDNSKDTLIINPHIQPNDTLKYGFGDIDKNNILNWNDYYLIDNSNLDEADIDGNGISGTQNDKKILRGYLNDSLEYLPAQWNNLLGSERINWLEKIIEIDKNTPINADMSNWNCENYTHQFIINTQGTNGNEIDSSFLKYDFTYDGRFNLPMFGLYLTNDSTKFYHRVNAILIGNYAKNFINWYIIEPQTHKKYDVEKDSRMEGGYAYMGYIRTNRKDIYFFLKFRIENQKAILMPLDLSSPPIKLIETRDTTNLRTTPIYTSLENQIIQKNIKQKFYPNPVSNIGIFKLSSPENSGLEIYNVYGEKILGKKFNSNEMKIDFSNYQNGIYFYKINQDKETYSGKIIKNN